MHAEVLRSQHSDDIALCEMQVDRSASILPDSLIPFISSSCPRSPVSQTSTVDSRVHKGGLLNLDKKDTYMAATAVPVLPLNFYASSVSLLRLLTSQCISGVFKSSGTSVYFSMGYTFGWFWVPPLFNLCFIVHDFESVRHKSADAAINIVGVVQYYLWIRPKRFSPVEGIESAFLLSVPAAVQ